MVRGLNTVPRAWEIEDCINNYHITLDLVCFSLYSIVDTNIIIYYSTVLLFSEDNMGIRCSKLTLYKSFFSFEK